MIKLGLIGFPLSHSLSPKIQAAALQDCGLEGIYSLYPVHPDEPQGVSDLLARVRSGEIHGLNVTIPHKQNVIPFLDSLTPAACAIGAVNTIYLHNNQLVGDNTDAPGFFADLQKLLTTALYSDDKTGGKGDLKVLVLGAGGSARAVIYALVNAGWEVMIAARRIEQSQEVALQFGKAKAIEFNPQTFQKLNLQLIVNTTPLGMMPNIDQSPWPENLPFPANAAIYDLVYNPSETKLVREARYQGLSATTGLGMLIEQAALAFEIWTGYQPLREIMFAAVKQTAD